MMDKIKLPNGFGSCYKLSGNRRKPYIARRTIGWDENGKQLYSTVGYYATRQEGLQALTKCSTKSPSSNVYFITDGRFIKIGKANNVKQRLSGLQTSSPYTLKVLKTLPFENEKDAFNAEKYFHNAFSNAQVMNEWFDISYEQVLLEIGRWC